MKINIKFFDCLPDDSKMIREKVFVVEQGFTEEFDTVDSDAVHFVAYDEGGTPIGTCRIFKKESDEIFYLGRLAVIKEYRKSGIGRLLLSAAEAKALSDGAEYIYLHSQLQAVRFYQKCGYREFGEIELEEGCPHIWMKKLLNQ